MQIEKPHFIIRYALFFAFSGTFGVIVYYGSSLLYLLGEWYFDSPFAITSVGQILGLLLYPIFFLLVLSWLAVPFLASRSVVYFVEEKELFFGSMIKAVKELHNFIWHRALLMINAFR